MKRLPQLTSLIAVVALSVSLAYWAMQLFKAPQRPINPPAVPVVQDASVEAGASLFGGQVSVASVSNYQLRGVVAAGNGRGSVAIIATDGKPSVALPAGAEVAPGVTVKEVQPRYVVLLDGGVSKRLELVADDKALSLPGAVGPVPMPAPQQPAPSLVPPPMPAEAQHRPGGVLMPAAGVVVSQPQPQPGTPPTN
ncbi:MULTISPECIES: type II secretion system protein N [unclassified Janthinobacterium]|uniref:type II secretion system protein N n=1 Tax=unclassified Janthinobacterium TaxID=2610881 RepID=UPI00161B5CD8|nr:MULTISPECIES: type II secretion system protein N [unclassified Janthinobacterium]MBB5370314.1 general secretion pathway protein C [Janthinobacterium sp. K2C7]MBB5383120.1 general secretion pathway protein C [Janthinobacterium sp. K2Li3]MBB5388401.1 general secretion pathway protein C [Janthinobacterium sp. K2E3]